MTKKLFSKFVSAILVMAICLTTVFGCLVTVNAADATGTYTITSDEVPSGARTATTYVTLTSDTGFSSGMFDLMFHDSLLDKDADGNVYEDGVTVLPTDTNGDGMISAYNVYELDAEGNIVLDEEGNKVVKEVIKENATNSGTRLPNAYDEKYVDTNGDGDDDDIVSNLYDTKIEIYSATATDGTVLDVDAAFAAPQDDTTGFDTNADGRKYKYELLEEYKNNEASETQLDKYSRSYSHIDVVTSNLSYDISTVSEDTTALVGRYCQYAQGFKNVSFDAGANTCKSITFKVTFDFLGRSDRMSANTVAPTQEEIENGTDRRADGRYCGDNQVQLGLNYILTLTPDSESAIAGFANTISDYRKSNFHIHFYHTTSKETDVISSGKDYTVYQGYCNSCPSTASTYKAPMIADNSVIADKFKESDSYYFHNYKNIYGFNVVYEDDGTLSVNIHFDQYSAGDTFVIGLSDGTKIAKYEDALNATTPETSFFATVEHWITENASDIIRDIRPLRTSGKMVTIKGLSAKDIDTELYIARMGNDGTGTVQIGRTHVFSLADYCMKVINEQDVYYVEDIIESDDTVDGTVNNTAASIEAQKQNDKNVAAALINYGKAAKAALNQSYDGMVAPTDKTIYWDGKTYTKPETIDSDGNILINTAEELAYIALKATAKESTGNNYKVADDIANIILQPENVVNSSKLMSLTDNAEVADYLTSLDGVVSWKATGSNCFNGNFDGNGVNIYGLYSNEGLGSTCGLFPFADGGKGRESDGLYQYKHAAVQDSSKEVIFPAEVITMDEYVVDNTGITIKNVALKNSYMNTGWRVGAFVGYTYPAYSYTNKLVNSNSNDADGSTTYDLDRSCTTANNAGSHVVGTINLDGCTLANCYITNSDANASNKGVLLGAISDENYHISNCLVYGNYTKASGINLYPVGGFTPHWVNNNLSGIRIWASIENTIYLDSLLHNGKAAWNSNTINSYENVYTNTEFAVTNSTDGIFTYAETDVAAITTDKVLGNAAIENMTNLDWSKWSYGPIGEYPTPASPDAITGRIEYWDGTEGGESVTYNDDGTIATNSLADNGEKGTSDDPIIIDTAEELAYIANATGNILNSDGTINTERGKNYNTAGVYFRVADDIDAIVLQPESVVAQAIMGLTSAVNVATHFDKNASVMKNWVCSQYNTATPFQGNFDGNGVIVYGLYHNQPTSTNYTGLIPVTGNGAVISNVTVANSYMVAGDNLGAITAFSRNGTSTNDNIIEFESCAVINCYMTTSTSAIKSVVRAGVLAGNLSHNIVVNNCLVYGNNARNTAISLPDGSTGFELSLLGNLTNNSPTNNKVTNSIILGATPYVKNNYSFAGHQNATISNVYTDKDVSSVKCYYINSSGEATETTQTFSTMTKVELANMIGSKAQTVVDTINAANGDSRDIYVGTIDGYPSFSKVPTITTDLLDDYAIMQFAYDKYGESTTKFGMYATSLNLKVNPYMAFTFAFAQGTPDYKANRDNITVTFKTASNTITTTVGNSKGGVSDGWTNNADAGRYHLYRLKDITVEDMYKGIEVTVNYGGTDYDFGTFSVGGFVLDLENAYKADPCEYYATRVEAAKALLFYTQMISARYA